MSAITTVAINSPNQVLATSVQAEPKDIKKRIIQQYEVWDQKLDAILPNFFFQNKLDAIAKLLQDTFRPLHKLNAMLNSNEGGAWYTQCATFLVKLPMRCVRNIIQLLYDIVSNLAYTCVHPLKSLNHAAKSLTQLVFELTKPECWSKMGASLLGASLGSACIGPHPISLIGVLIAGAMICGGVSAGALRAALGAQNGNRFTAVGEHLKNQALQFPEAMLTGFCMGLIMGAIRRCVQENTIVEPKTYYAEGSEWCKVPFGIDPATGEPRYILVYLGDADWEPWDPVAQDMIDAYYGSN